MGWWRTRWGIISIRTSRCVPRGDPKEPEPLGKGRGGEGRERGQCDPKERSPWGRGGEGRERAQVDI